MVETNGYMIRDTALDINNKTYKFNEDGRMVTGWLQNQDDWYYFSENGTMQVGWYKHYWNDNEDFDWYYYDANGEEHHGWLTLGSKKYYMHPTTGEMYHSITATIDGVSLPLIKITQDNKNAATKCKIRYSFFLCLLQ